jgi:hypothetical protein
LTHHFYDLWFLPALLYAETHFRFPYFFSFLKKGEPEVIADAPHRLEPGRQLPVLILVKDAHLFPITLREVSIEIRQGEHTAKHVGCLEGPVELREKMVWRIIPFDVSNLAGWVELDVSFTLERQGISKTYRNDNHRTSSHEPLRVFLASEPLPRFTDLYLGDPHTHSHYTDDQVEFGVPLIPAVTLAQAMGLSYFCVTDHSYDLDDHPDSYLRNDSTLKKWNEFQIEVDQANATVEEFVVVRGEEVSCRNSEGRNVHFLILGQREFIQGSGDGAERWLETRSEHSIEDVLKLMSTNAVAFAAHAREPVPLLQRLLLGRGIWNDNDLGLENLTGMQVINGRLDSAFQEGYRAWTRLLLKGKKLLAIAGNDAHGNFNRFRQIGIPFLTIRESSDQIFGKMRTGIFLHGGISEQGLINSLDKGDMIITDGPVARLSARGMGSDAPQSRDSARGETIEVDVEIHSTPEFGEISSVKVIVGRSGEKSERTAFRFDGNQGFSMRKQIPVKQSALSYVRVEAWTSASGSYDKKQHLCLTNPLWIYPPH